jgi:ABC-type multidrug transport system fused ATPase/permease subunit
MAAGLVGAPTAPASPTLVLALALALAVLHVARAQFAIEVFPRVTCARPGTPVFIFAQNPQLWLPRPLSILFSTEHGVKCFTVDVQQSTLGYDGEAPETRLYCELEDTLQLFSNQNATVQFEDAFPLRSGNVLGITDETPNRFEPASASPDLWSIGAFPGETLPPNAQVRLFFHEESADCFTKFALTPDNEQEKNFSASAFSVLVDKAYLNTTVHVEQDFLRTGFREPPSTLDDSLIRPRPITFAFHALFHPNEPGRLTGCISFRAPFDVFDPTHCAEVSPPRVPGQFVRGSVAFDLPVSVANTAEGMFAVRFSRVYDGEPNLDESRSYLLTDVTVSNECELSCETHFDIQPDDAWLDEIRDLDDNTRSQFCAVGEDWKHVIRASSEIFSRDTITSVESVLVRNGTQSYACEGYHLENQLFENDGTEIWCTVRPFFTSRFDAELVLVSALGVERVIANVSYYSDRDWIVGVSNETWFAVDANEQPLQPGLDYFWSDPDPELGFDAALFMPPQAATLTHRLADNYKTHRLTFTGFVVRHVQHRAVFHPCVTLVTIESSIEICDENDEFPLYDGKEAFQFEADFSEGPSLSEHLYYNLTFRRISGNGSLLFTNLSVSGTCSVPRNVSETIPPVLPPTVLPSLSLKPQFLCSVTSNGTYKLRIEATNSARFHYKGVARVTDIDVRVVENGDEIILPCPILYAESSTIAIVCAFQSPTPLRNGSVEILQMRNIFNEFESTLEALYADSQNFGIDIMDAMFGGRIDIIHRNTADAYVWVPPGESIPLVFLIPFLAGETQLFLSLQVVRAHSDVSGPTIELNIVSDGDEVLRANVANATIRDVQLGGAAYIMELVTPPEFSFNPQTERPVLDIKRNGDNVREFLVSNVKLFRRCRDDLLPSQEFNLAVVQPDPVLDVQPQVLCNQFHVDLLLSTFLGDPDPARRFDSTGARAVANVTVVLADHAELPCENPTPIDNNSRLNCSLNPQDVNGRIVSVRVTTVLGNNATFDTSQHYIVAPTENLVSTSSGWASSQLPTCCVGLEASTIEPSPILFVNATSRNSSYFVMPSSVSNAFFRASTPLSFAAQYYFFMRVFRHANDTSSLALTFSDDIGQQTTFNITAPPFQFVDLNFSVTGLNVDRPLFIVLHRLETGPTPGNVLVSDASLSVACAPSVDLAQRFRDDMALPANATLANKTVCPDILSRVSLTAIGRNFGTHFANKPSIVRIANFTCLEPIIISHERLSCNILATSEAEGFVQMEAPFTGVVDYPDLRFAVAREQLNMLSPGTNWTLLREDGSVISSQVLARRDSTERSVAFDIVPAGVSVIETLIDMRYIPQFVHLIGQYAISNEDSIRVKLLTCVAAILRNGSVSRCEDAHPNQGSQPNIFVNLPLNLSEPHYTLQVSIKVVDKHSRNITRSLLSEVRFLALNLTDVGRCAGSAPFHYTGPQPFNDSQALSVNDVFPSEIVCLPTRAAGIPISFTTNAFQDRRVDWALFDELLSNGTLSSSASRRPWLLSATLQHASGELPCEITSYNRSTGSVQCKLMTPDDLSVAGPIIVHAGGRQSSVAQPTAWFSYTKCAREESTFARATEDATRGITGVGLTVGLLTSAAAVITVATSHTATASAGAAVGQGDIFRMVYYVQFISALSTTNNELPLSSQRLGRNFAWMNGMMLPPWAECVDPNEGRNITLLGKLPDDGPCIVPEDQLFLGAVFWLTVLAFILLVFVGSVLFILRYLWYRVRSVRSSIDVDTFANLPLVPLMVTVRILLLACTGLTTTIFFQIRHEPDKYAPTVFAIVLLVVYVIGMPVLNLILIRRLSSRNVYLADSTRQKAQFAFGALFGEYREAARTAAVYSLVKRMLVAAIIGSGAGWFTGQLSLIMSICYLYALFTLLEKPFAVQSENVLHALLEGAEGAQAMFQLIFIQTGRAHVMSVGQIVTCVVILIFASVTVWRMAWVQRAWVKLQKMTGAGRKPLDQRAFELDNDTAERMIRRAKDPSFGKLATTASSSSLSALPGTQSAAVQQPPRRKFRRKKKQPGVPGAPSTSTLASDAQSSAVELSAPRQQRADGESHREPIRSQKQREHRPTKASVAQRSSADGAQEVDLEAGSAGSAHNKEMRQ